MEARAFNHGAHPQPIETGDRVLSQETRDRRTGDVQGAALHRLVDCSRMYLAIVDHVYMGCEIGTAQPVRGQRRVNVVVGDISEPTISLSVTAYKDKGTQHAYLVWSDSGAGPFDIYRDSVLITTVSGSVYTDNLQQKGGGSTTYRVCEAGTNTCSNDAEANW